MAVKPTPARRLLDGDPCSLRRFDIFKDVDDAELPALERRLRGAQLRKGSTYHPEVGLQNGLLLVSEGSLQLYRESRAGRKLEIARIGPGTFVVGKRLSAAHVEALADTVVCIVTEADLEWMVLHHPHVALRIMPVLFNRLIKSDERLETMVFWPVRARIARVLLQLEHAGVVAETTHQELADIVAATRETVTMALNQLAADGVLALAHSRISILKRDRLQAVAGD